MEHGFNIVEIIEKNPIKVFNKEYQNKFINKIKDNFNENEQKLFIASFYSYLNYNSDNDYIIDIEDIWKWLQFSRKDAAKRILEKNFEKDIDYKIIITQIEKTTSSIKDAAPLSGGAGLNKETILMTIDTFKELCIKANTKKAKEIRKYFIKLEKIFHEIINEEVKELKEQLKLKDKKIEDKENETLLKTQKILLQSYNFKNVIYLIKLEENIYKFGYSDNIKERFKQHKNNMKTDIRLIFCIESADNKKLENDLKTYLLTTNYRITEMYNGYDYKEIIKISNDDIAISNITKKKLNGIDIIIDKLNEYNEDINNDKLVIMDLKKRIKQLEDLLEMSQSSDNSINSNNEYKNKFIKKTEEWNRKENKLLANIKELDTEIITLKNEILKYNKYIIELESQNKYLNERYSDYDNLKEEIKKQKQIINDYEKRYNTISTHIVSIDKGKEILENVNKIFIKKEDKNNEGTKKTYIRKPFVLPKIEFDDLLFISINENEKKEFKNEYLLDFLVPNPKNKILLNDLIKYLEARYINIYNTRDFKLKLITFIKNNFENINTPESHISSDDKRLRFKTDFYIENISINGYSSLFSEIVYENFVEEYLEIKTNEKIKIKGNETYKYFIFADDLYNKFNEYLEKNNIKYIFYNKDCRIIDIFKDDLQKYICKLTNSLKTSTVRDKREYVIFATIIFKDNN